MHHPVAGLTEELAYSNETVVKGLVAEEGNLENLYPAIVQCFGIILVGFLAGKFSFISDVEAQGLGTFVGTFSLPALIFLSLCQLDFTSVNWTFMAAITIAKSSVFLLVLLVGLFTHRPSNIARAALYAIFCTQSNDFALGFPVLNAIYGSTHPDYPTYLYLLAPVSLALLNPIGFVLMEIGRSSGGDEGTGVPRTKVMIAKKVVKGLLKNPLLTMTVLGIVGNLVFHGNMPDIIHQFMATLGSAFSASALFLLGLRMVSQGRSAVVVKTSLLTPFILITMKSVVLPIVAREVVSQLGAGKDANETLDLSNYAFLYGTIPTAPAVFVFATNYDILPDMIASAITTSTFMAAPLMFVTAKLLTIMNMNPGDYIEELDTFLLDVSIVGLLAAMWVVLVLMITQRASKMPHSLTLILAVSQGIACTGAVLWSVLDCRHGWRLYLQFIVFGYGVFASRVSTAVLAVSLLLLQTRPLCSNVRWRPYLVAVALGLPAILVAALTISVAVETPEHGPKQDPNFQYGTTQAVMALVVLLACLFTTLLSMILAHRYQTVSGARLSPSGGVSETDALLVPETEPVFTDITQESSVEIEDLVLPGVGCRGRGEAQGGRYRCDSTHREYCSGLIRRYEVPPAEDALSSDNLVGGGDEDDRQLLHHNLLLLFLCVSMFVGAALCIWTLFMEKFSGIYLELVFFDGFLNLGQSIFTFAIFGINVKGIAREVARYTRRLLYGKDQISLPPWEDLDPTTRAVSTMFIKHHLAVCVEQTLHDLPGVLGSRGVVLGWELVSWLEERGLVHSRQDGEVFGRHLLRGRVIRHVDNHLDFYDDKTVYTFKPVEGDGLRGNE